MLKKILTFYAIFFLIFNINAETISPENPAFTYYGRIDYSNPTKPTMFWTGNSIDIIFEGTKLEISLNDTGKNYYNIIIDDDLNKQEIIKCKKGLNNYRYNKPLTNGKHKLTIYRRTDLGAGGTIFCGIKIDSNKKVYKVPEKKLKIEFYGDSITCGYGVEDKSRKDNANPLYANNYLAYSSIVARELNADAHYIAKGGIGITCGFVPYNIDEIYNKLEPLNKKSKEWDFASWQPNIVVINLFQNDSALIGMKNKNKNFLKRFPNGQNPSEQYILSKYVSFLKQLINKYPNATFICALGNMTASKKGSKWVRLKDEAVNNIKKLNKDIKIYSLTFPYKATPQHPNISEQKRMADQLIKFIKTKYKNK